MKGIEATRVILVNEVSVIVEPAASITDKNGKTLSSRHLKPGRWVSAEAEPNEDSQMVAERIVLNHKR
jgi:hypothetical protein